jgi:outer membrane immunogenic protein
MRSYVIAGMLLGSVTIAHAADLTAKAPYAPIPVSNWSGMYIGGFAGGAWVDGQFTGAGGFPPKQSFHESGFLGGVYLGYDYELPDKFILGARVSLPLGEINTTSTVTGIVGLAPTIAPKMLWATMTDLTFGYDLGQWEPYLGVGAVFVDNKATLNVAGAPSESDTELHTGLDVMAGIKYAYTKNWDVGLQYNHDVISSQTYNFGPTFAASGSGNASFNALFGTIEYRF